MDYLTRANDAFPKAVVPLAGIVTIGNPDAEQAVFGDMRHCLQAHRTQMAETRTAARMTPLPWPFAAILTNEAEWQNQ